MNGVSLAQATCSMHMTNFPFPSPSSCFVQLKWIAASVSGLSVSLGNFQGCLDWLRKYRRASWKFRLFSALMSKQ